MLSKNRVPNQTGGEEIVMHLWRHWFIFFKIIVGFLFFSLLPVGLFLFLNNTAPGILTNEIGRALLTVLALIYYLAALVIFFTAWTSVYLDVYTITTHRIINREQLGLFNRTVSEIDLSRIQDVAAEQKGMLATFLNYGNVYIQSAGEVERFVFVQIADPYRIAKILEKLDENAKKFQPQGL